MIKILDFSSSEWHSKPAYNFLTPILIFYCQVTYFFLPRNEALLLNFTSDTCTRTPSLFATLFYFITWQWSWMCSVKSVGLKLELWLEVRSFRNSHGTRSENEYKRSTLVRVYTQTNKTPGLYCASELYRLSDCRLSTKLVPTLANRGCCVVSETNPHGR
jgi:hypothetical protein